MFTRPSKKKSVLHRSPGKPVSPLEAQVEWSVAQSWGDSFLPDLLLKSYKKEVLSQLHNLLVIVSLLLLAPCYNGIDSFSALHPIKLIFTLTSNYPSANSAALLLESLAAQQRPSRVKKRACRRSLPYHDFEFRSTRRQ